MNATSILLLLGIAESILAKTGLIPAAWQPLAAGIISAISVVKADLTNTQGQISASTASIIAAINDGIQQLAQVGALGAGSGIAKALASAVNAGEQAETGITSVDPSKLQPIS